MLWALGLRSAVEVLAYCAHRVTKDMRRDGASEFTAPDARRAEMHAPKDARVGHFFDGTFKPYERSDCPWHDFRGRIERDVIAEECAEDSGRRPGQVRVS